MAASVVSLTPIEIDNDHKEELDWVLPSEIDCRGRPLPKVALTAAIRKMLSLESIRSFVVRFRQPSF